MDDDTARRTLEVLEAIRDQQRQQLARQDEALALQRQQYELVRQQAERLGRTQDRAEQIQAKSGELVANARKLFVLIVPVLLGLIVYVTWLIFRR